MHRYQFVLDGFGDWVVLEKLEPGGWIECTRWLVPGSQIDEFE